MHQIKHRLKGLVTSRSSGSAKPQDSSSTTWEVEPRGNSAKSSAEELAEQVEAFRDSHNRGAVELSLIGPDNLVASVKAHVRWVGSDKREERWEDDRKGLVPPQHVAFELYRRPRFFKLSYRDGRREKTQEDDVIFDLESWLAYENVNPGTLTVEGFGLECWEYELVNGKPRNNRTIINRSEMPSLKAEKILRRLDEIKKFPAEQLGWNTAQDNLDLKEFTGDMGITYYGSYGQKMEDRISELYSLLNRDDIFADFSEKSSIVIQFAGLEGLGIGIWNVLWQVILSKELANRLRMTDSGWTSGFTKQVLASLIVGDLWTRNVELKLTEMPLQPIKGPETAEEQTKVNEAVLAANQALDAAHYQQAFDDYTTAISIDLADASLRLSRAEASIRLDNLEAALEDAVIATRVDPKFTSAWVKLGDVQLLLGNGVQAKKAYEQANNKPGIAKAEARIEADWKGVEATKDNKTRDSKRKTLLDQEYETIGMNPSFFSNVHERQVDGLLHFAAKMKWPFYDEMRSYAEDAYANMRGGIGLPNNLYDWLFGLTLPGRWMSYKIMAALVNATPSQEKLATAPYLDAGLALEGRSYWRIRTVLGRVLGSLPGVNSLCGWIGPCPPVDTEPRWIRLKSRSVTPICCKNVTDTIYMSSNNSSLYAEIPWDDIKKLKKFAKDYMDKSKYAVPIDPAGGLPATFQKITLKKLPLDVDSDGDAEAEYRASIAFEVKGRTTTFTLYTNPRFVTPPSCDPGPKGAHEIHERERLQFSNVLGIDKLEVPDDGKVLVINATGAGAETLARAWCAEKGMDALVRRQGGACFTCCVRGASREGLGVGVVIWVS